MKLYEIDEGIRALWNKVIEQDGELTEEDIQALESLEVAKDEKIKAYGVVIRETLSEIERVKAETERLDKIGKQMQRKVDWLTNRLSGFMVAHEMQNYKSLEVNISFRTSKRLCIADGTKLAKKWMKMELKPDKQAIKDFLSNGGKVKGCSIDEIMNIQIK
jgi:predicted RNase H-like nuclease (RuvC/YqgF family)